MLSLLHLICVTSPVVHVLAVSTLDNLDNNMAFQDNKDIKPGHHLVKEFHFHPYWHQNNPQEVSIS